MKNAHAREDRFVGGVLGLALGDAVGAPHEGAMGHATNWQNLSLTSPGFGHYTDDTEMALGVLRSHAACGGFDADHLATTWAERADPGRGYGGGALRVLGMIRDGVPWQEANRRVFPDGSFGNGGAMRATPIGLLHADDPESLDAAARKAAEVTHAHPLGIDGSVLIARAAAAAFRDASAAAVLTSINAGDLAPEFRTRVDAAREMANATPRPSRVRSPTGSATASSRTNPRSRPSTSPNASRTIRSTTSCAASSPWAGTWTRSARWPVACGARLAGPPRCRRSCCSGSRTGKRSSVWPTRFTAEITEIAEMLASEPLACRNRCLLHRTLALPGDGRHIDEKASVFAFVS